MGARKALCKPHLAFSETKLALLPGSAAHPVQNSPSKRPWQAHPVQNSPSEPQNADFGPPFACRENFLPLPPPTTRAGRTLSRMRGRFRYKTLPASGLGRPTRYKTLPAARLGDPPGTKLSQRAALAGPPGTKLSQRARLGGQPGTKLAWHAPKRRFRPILRQQGELCTVSAGLVWFCGPGVLRVVGCYWWCCAHWRAYWLGESQPSALWGCSSL